MLPKSDVCHNNRLGAGDANCSGFIKMHLKGVTNVCSLVKLPFSHFKSSFFVNLSLTFYALGRGQMQPFICGGGFSSLVENCKAFRAIGEGQGPFL